MKINKNNYVTTTFTSKNKNNKTGEYSHQKVNKLATYFLPISLAMATACNPSLKISQNTYNKNNTLNVEVPKPELDVKSIETEKTKELETKQYDVIIDAGHDSINVKKGCIWHGQKIMENVITRDIAEQVEQNLQDEGYYVKILLDEKDTANVFKRRELKDFINPKCFVSIHANWNYSPRAHGIEAFYNSKTDCKLAKCIYNAYKKEGYSMRKNNGKHIPKKANMIVTMDHSENLKENPNDDGINVPSTLIETGFMSNYQDSKTLMTPKGKAKHAKVIADGIEDFLTKYLKVEPQFNPVKK